MLQYHRLYSIISVSRLTSVMRLFQFDEENFSLSSIAREAWESGIKLENIHNQFIQSEVFLPNFKLTSLSLAHHLFYLITPT